MSGSTAKQKVLEAIEKLPADATLEDAIERLVFLAKIERGLVELDAGKGVDHAEAKRRLRRGPRSSGHPRRSRMSRPYELTWRATPPRTLTLSWSELSPRSPDSRAILCLDAWYPKLVTNPSARSSRAATGSCTA